MKSLLVIFVLIAPVADAAKKVPEKKYSCQSLGQFQELIKKAYVELGGQKLTKKQKKSLMVGSSFKAQKMTLLSPSSFEGLPASGGVTNCWGHLVSIGKASQKESRQRRLNLWKSCVIDLYGQRELPTYAEHIYDCLSESL